MTEPNLSASAETGDQCEITAPAISQSDVVQRARQALDGITPGEWSVYSSEKGQLGIPYVGDHTDDDRHTQWRLPDHGWSLLHGHTHSTSRGDSHMVHVGVDAWGRPVSRDEITPILNPAH